MLQNTKESIIVGGGITGLIWAFYHPRFKIFTPLVGGQFSKKQLVLLHDTVETEKLMKDLGLTAKKRAVKLGFYYKGWVHDYQNEKINEIVIKKKMTEWDKPLSNLKTTSSSMSTADIDDLQILNILDVDLNEVIKKLETTAKIVNAIVTEINPTSVITKLEPDSKDFQYVKYDKLVSTIAAPYFWKTWKGPANFNSLQFEALPTTNVEIKECPQYFDSDYDIIYYDDSVPFSRVSKMENSYVIEFTGEVPEQWCKEMTEKASLTMLNRNVVKFGRIFENVKNSSPSKNIVFSGRFSQWKYGIVVEHVIKQALSTKL